MIVNTLIIGADGTQGFMDKEVQDNWYDALEGEVLSPEEQIAVLQQQIELLIDIVAQLMGVE